MTHPQIGIAYDDYSFTFVQNFEDNYIQPNKQPFVAQEENNDDEDDDNSKNNI
jgi:hypothetical protein